MGEAIELKVELQAITNQNGAFCNSTENFSQDCIYAFSYVHIAIKAKL